MNRLKEIREEKNLLQKDIAKLLNISQQHYSLYEIEDRSLPIEKYIILAKFYNTSIDYIVCLTNEKRPYPKK